MFCPYCGNESKAPGALFCSQCGKPLNAEIEAPGATAGALLAAGSRARRAWLGWPFWVLLLLALLCAWGSLVLVHTGQSASSQRFIVYGVVDTALFTGALMAYVWRKRSRSGWAGFGLGLITGLALLYATSFVVGAVRYHFAAAPTLDLRPLEYGQPPERVKPFVDPDTLPNKGRDGWETAPDPTK